MSDGLVKRWWSYTDEGNSYNYGDMEECPDGDYVEYQDYKLASDRIEQLAATNEELEDKLSKSEALLAKAVAQMQRVKDFRYDPNIGIELNLLEATLAELSSVSCANLKGQDDE